MTKENDTNQASPQEETTSKENASTGASPEKNTEATPNVTVSSEEAAFVPEEDPVAALQSDLEKFRDLALRGQADLDNYRKRSIRDKEDAIRNANASLLKRLISILDNFELGLNAAKEATEAKIIYDGMLMVYKQFETFLTDSGVTQVVTENAPFDPNEHDALAQEASDTVPEGQVLREVRKGYKLHDRLLRAANVIVSKGPEQKA